MRVFDPHRPPHPHPPTPAVKAKGFRQPLERGEYKWLGLHLFKNKHIFILFIYLFFLLFKAIFFVKNNFWICQNNVINLNENASSWGFFSAIFGIN